MRNKKHNRIQSDIQKTTLKYCVPGRIINDNSGNRDPTLQKRKGEMIKVVSNISASLNTQSQCRLASNVCFKAENVETKAQHVQPLLLQL